MRIRTIAVVILGSLMLSSCSAGNMGEPTPTPTVQVSLPNTGESLARLGFTNEAASMIWIPDHVTLTYTADQGNLLIVTGIISEAKDIEAYLRGTLPGLGWEITSESSGALMFSNEVWHGAYVEGDQSWALTVRND